MCEYAVRRLSIEAHHSRCQKAVDNCGVNHKHKGLQLKLVSIGLEAMCSFIHCMCVCW